MKLLLIKEVAEQLRCSSSQVYNLIQTGRLRCYRITAARQGGVRVSEEQLAEYLANSEYANAEEEDLPHLR